MLQNVAAAYILPFKMQCSMPQSTTVATSNAECFSKAPACILHLRCCVLVLLSANAAG